MLLEDVEARRIFRPVLAQIVMTAVLMAAALPFDRLIAISAGLGGLCCVVPSGYAAFRLVTRTVTADNALKHFMAAQGGKFALTFGMLVAVFVLVDDLAAGWFFGAMLLVQLTLMIVPLISRTATDDTVREH